MRHSIASLRLYVVVAAILTAATHAANSCFNTDPPYTVVRGKPFTLTWQLQGSDYDLFLATIEGESLGYISRNITASSLSWTPPLNISDGPFSFGLFMLNRQSTCFSNNFTITGSQNAEFEQLSGPFATQVVTINTRPTTVIATVASWTPNARATATQTPTPTPIPTTYPLTEDPSSGLSNAAKIGIGVAIGALVLIVLVLGILLYRTRRKRTNALPAPPSPLDPPDTKLKLGDESNRSSSYTELDGAQRSELVGRERVQLEGRGKPEGWRPGTEYSEMSTGATEGRWELDAGRDGVAELPGDEPREKKG